MKKEAIDGLVENYSVGDADERTGVSSMFSVITAFKFGSGMTPDSD